ncbi:uncharacterized, partial [Tachysurus ichikawai]
KQAKAWHALNDLARLANTERRIRNVELIPHS